jgi:hypothetical protein
VSLAVLLVLQLLLLLPQLHLQLLDQLLLLLQLFLEHHLNATALQRLRTCAQASCSSCSSASSQRAGRIYADAHGA